MSDIKALSGGDDGDGSAGANKRVVEAYVEAFSKGEFDRLRALHAPDAVIHGVLDWGPIDAVPQPRPLGFRV